MVGYPFPNEKHCEVIAEVVAIMKEEVVGLGAE